MSDMMPRPYNPADDTKNYMIGSKQIKPINLNDFINEDVKDAFVLGTYSCKYVSLVDSPTANAQENATYTLQDKLLQEGS